MVRTPAFRSGHGQVRWSPSLPIFFWLRNEALMKFFSNCETSVLLNSMFFLKEPSTPELARVAIFLKSLQGLSGESLTGEGLIGEGVDETGTVAASLVPSCTSFASVNGVCDEIPKQCLMPQTASCDKQKSDYFTLRSK